MSDITLKGVIYARYSSDNQREESIEGQLRECNAYAKEKGITILGAYTDRAISGTKEDRPEFQKLIKDSEKGMFEVVLVWKLDRFARDRYYSAHYKHILKKNGVKVISATEHISENSEGILMESLLEGMAEYYSAELSEKVRRGMKENALKGKHTSGSVPLGLCLDANRYFQIDEKLAPVVLEVFIRYKEGATMKELADDLNARGIRTVRGKEISLNVIERMLSNRKYIGEYWYHDMLIEDAIPAIVSKDLFDLVQERRRKNKKAPARFKAEDAYLLTTKLHCGKCGAFMVGESGTSHTKEVHRYYRCVNTKKKKVCTKKAVKKDWIENLVIHYTKQVIMNDDMMERLIDMLYNLQNKESDILPTLKKQLADIQKRIENILNAIESGIFTPSTKQRLDELERTKSQLEVSIMEEEWKKPVLKREEISFFVYRFRGLDLDEQEERQRLIDSFVNSVYLYDDKCVITFNYKDGTKTITLKDVEGSNLFASSAVIAVKTIDKSRWFFLFLAFFVRSGMLSSDV